MGEVVAAVGAFLVGNMRPQSAFGSVARKARAPDGERVEIHAQFERATSRLNGHVEWVSTNLMGPGKSVSAIK